MGADLMSVPESPEVISQAASNLRDLYRRVCSSRGRARYRDALTQEMLLLCEQPERTLRVAMLLGEEIVVPIRHQFDLEDPDAGMYFANVDHTEPEPGEWAAGIFLNHLLRGDRDAAHDVFHHLVLAEPNHELRNFLGLILAITAVA